MSAITATVADQTVFTATAAAPWCSMANKGTVPVYVSSGGKAATSGFLKELQPGDSFLFKGVPIGGTLVVATKGGSCAIEAHGVASSGVGVVDNSGGVDNAATFTAPGATYSQSDEQNFRATVAARLNNLDSLLRQFLAGNK